MLDVITLVGLFVLLAYGVLRGIDAPDEARLALGGLAIAAAAAGAALVLYLARDRLWASRLIGFLAPIGRATLELRGRHGAAMLALTGAIWALEAGTYFAVGGAVGLDVNPLEAVYLVALTSVFVMVPAGPGYLGTLDAAVIFGVRAIGGSGAAALSYLLMLRFVLIVPITIAGLAILVLRYGGWAAIPRVRASGT